MMMVMSMPLQKRKELVRTVETKYSTCYMVSSISNLDKTVGSLHDFF